jgi:hypothetical protein
MDRCPPLCRSRRPAHNILLPIPPWLAPTMRTALATALRNAEADAALAHLREEAASIDAALAEADALRDLLALLERAP